MTRTTRIAITAAAAWLAALALLAPHTTRGTIDPQLVETVGAQP